MTINQPPAALRPILVTPNASMRMGGEAALGFHLFRVLRNRGVDVRLLTHARNRRELLAAFPDDHDRLLFIEDGRVHRLLWSISRRLPDRIARASVGLLDSLILQWKQRRVVRQLVLKGRVNLVHEPAPVSPAQPSLMSRVGAPVVFGPLNGGMNFPPAFREREDKLEWIVVRIARQLSWLANLIIPGKRRAATILVANQRSRDALPPGVGRHCPVVELPENGVDLDLWRNVRPSRRAVDAAQDGGVRFVFLGRLVRWKGVDLLLESWAKLVGSGLRVPVRLQVIGDGAELSRLKDLAGRLKIEQSVDFTGWLPQREAARLLSEAEVLVHPSMMDCGAAVVLEGMAAGLPVIATAWGGPLDYVTRECGILVPPTGHGPFVAALAEAMERLARDEHLRNRMGAAGRKRAARHYDWGRKGEAIERVYERVLACRAGPLRSQSTSRDDAGQGDGKQKAPVVPLAARSAGVGERSSG